MKYPIGIQSFQSGYLTIKDVDRRFNTYLLDFPNTEVKQGMVTLLAKIRKVQQVNNK